MRRVSLRLAAALLLAAAFPARMVQAQADPVLHGFQRSGVRVLVIDGKEDKGAEIYLNEQIPAYLILPSEPLSPILLTPRAGTVATVGRGKIAKQKDGSVDLLAGAPQTPQGRFQVQGQDVTFTSEGKPVRLVPSPPLLGLHTNADLKAHSPEYIRTAEPYQPSAAALATLKKAAQPVTVRVIFGSWCPFCRGHVPLLLKAEDLLGPSKIRFEYYGIAPHDFQDAEAQRLKIQSVPTAVVTLNGREIGRIEAPADWSAPETALAKIVDSNKPGAGK
jgi:thiol-disulfide isomerase/thioredoxin